VVRAFSLPDLSPCRVDIPDSFSGVRRGKIISIAASAGIPVDSDALLSRLYDVLIRFRRNKLPEGSREGGCFLFADDRHVLVLVPVSDPDFGDTVSLDMRFPFRTIRAMACLTGVLRVNRTAAIVDLTIKDAQEEDRRFLYENLYSDLYRGQP
jgi:hypothetical protein